MARESRAHAIILALALWKVRRPVFDVSNWGVYMSQIGLIAFS